MSEKIMLTTDLDIEDDVDQMTRHAYFISAVIDRSIIEAFTSPNHDLDPNKFNL